MRDTLRTPPSPSEPSAAFPALPATELASILNSNTSPEPPTNGLASPPNGNASTTDTHASGTSSPPPRLLPQLPYSLRDHKQGIAVVWTLALDAAIMSLVLFYPLWYDTSLLPAYILAITTALVGMISGLE